MRLHLLLVPFALVACKPAAEKDNSTAPATASVVAAKDAPPALGPFSKIRNEGTAAIDATVGKAQSVTVACSDGGSTARVMLSVTGNELLVKTKQNENTRCTVTVMPEVTGVSPAGEIRSLPSKATLPWPSASLTVAALVATGR